MPIWVFQKTQVKLHERQQSRRTQRDDLHNTMTKGPKLRQHQSPPSRQSRPPGRWDPNRKRDKQVYVIICFWYQWYKQTISFQQLDLKEILPTRLASSFESLYLGIMEAAAAEVEAEAAADGVTAEEHGKGKWKLNFSYHFCVLKELSFVKCWYIVFIQCLFCLEYPTSKKNVQSRLELRILQGYRLECRSCGSPLWKNKRITQEHGPNTTNIIMR